MDDGAQAGAREEQCASLCRPGAAYPLESRAGGDFAEWIRRVYEVAGDPLSEAGEPMRWLHGICRREGRTDRLVNCLLRAEKAAQAQLERERGACARERAAAEALAREIQFVRRMLESRDQQFAALQAEFLAMRRSWVWRLARRARCAAGRARRLLAPRGAPGWGRA